MNRIKVTKANFISVINKLVDEIRLLKEEVKLLKNEVADLKTLEDLKEDLSLVSIDKEETKGQDEPNLISKNNK